MLGLLQCGLLWIGLGGAVAGPSAQQDTGRLDHVRRSDRPLERMRERLRARERAVDRAAPRELRRRLEELDGDQARELWFAHLRERFRERGRELRERLPESQRRRLERSSPEERRRFLERLFREREPVSRKALARMHERFGLPRGEIQRLERLPLAERLHAMLQIELRSRAAPGAEREGG